MICKCGHSIERHNKKMHWCSVVIGINTASATWCPCMRFKKKITIKDLIKNYYKKKNDYKM